MAQITFNIPDDQVDRIAAAIGWTPGGGSRREALFVWLRTTIRRAVLNHEAREAMRAATENHIANYQAPDITEG